MAKEIVTFEVAPYGEFKAAIRDFETELRISYTADEQMSARGMDPTKASGTTRMLFYYLASFSQSCEQMPAGFDAKKLLESSPSEGYVFLTTYNERLTDKEQSFRKGDKEVPEGEPGTQGSTEATV